MAATDVQEAERELKRARENLHYQMDHLSKYARAICEQIDEGVAPDALIGATLEQTLSSYRRVRNAEKRLAETRMGLCAHHTAND